MSESEQDASVLGKRARNGEGSPAKEEDPVPMVEDEDDEDVGPMPMPADTVGGGAKKKRKGEHNSLSQSRYLTLKQAQFCLMRSSILSIYRLQTGIIRVSCTEM